jgi:hypothetical protein
LFSSNDVVNSNSSATAKGFPFLVAGGDRPAAGVAYFLNQRIGGSPVNEYMHVLYASGSATMRLGNSQGIVISPPSIYLSSSESKRKKSGGGNDLDKYRPFGEYQGRLGPTFSRSDRFPVPDSVPYDIKIYTFFIGCSKFEYPVLVLECYNYVKNDRMKLLKFLNKVVVLESYTYVPIKLTDDNQWLPILNQITNQPEDIWAPTWSSIQERARVSVVGEGQGVGQGESSDSDSSSVRSGHTDRNTSMSIAGKFDSSSGSDNDNYREAETPVFNRGPNNKYFQNGLLNDSSDSETDGGGYKKSRNNRKTRKTIKTRKTRKTRKIRKTRKNRKTRKIRK